MHIVNIVPGFGGTFYCGNCLRDSGYTKALRESGHESTTLPIYLPLSMDHIAREEDIPVFIYCDEDVKDINFEQIKKHSITGTVYKNKFHEEFGSILQKAKIT